MNESSPTRSVTAADIYAHRLVIVALIASFATFLIAAVYPSGRSADASSSLSFAAAHGWLAAQSFALAIPGLVLGLLVGKLLPRLGAWLGAAVMLAVPVIVLCDVIAFTWIAERFLSDAMMRIGTTLLPAIMVHVTLTQIITSACLIAFICFSMFVTWTVAGSSMVHAPGFGQALGCRGCICRHRVGAVDSRTCQPAPYREGNGQVVREASVDALRAVISFMFGTHLNESYSDPQDRVFLPAQKSDFPHSYEPEIRERVYNCYKNSFRTMDRMIAPLLRDDCVVIVLGDQDHFRIC
jgi:hypothetical protein